MIPINVRRNYIINNFMNNSKRSIDVTYPKNFESSGDPFLDFARIISQKNDKNIIPINCTILKKIHRNQKLVWDGSKIIRANDVMINDFGAILDIQSERTTQKTDARLTYNDLPGSLIKSLPSKIKRLEYTLGE